MKFEIDEEANKLLGNKNNNSNDGLSIPKRIANHFKDEPIYILYIVSIFIFTTFGIIYGILYRNECPIEPNIPIFCILMSAVNMLHSILVFYNKLEGLYWRQHSIASAINILLLSSMGALVIAGAYWHLHTMHIISEDPSSAHYCHPKLYSMSEGMFALGGAYFSLYFCLMGFYKISGS